MKKKHAIVYWLIPARDERDLFRAIIRILADELDAPRFEPHLTLLSAQDRQSPRKVLRQLKASPIRLRVREIGFSPKFTKTLFIRFHSSPALRKLIGDLGGRSISDPHLSLLYKKMSILAKREVASIIKMPFREVVFDSVVAMRCVSPTKTRADIEAWQTLARKKLAR